ncbi:transposable element Tc1 transposase [Trichonephila clavipes]|nr:transposable element Tc1 transposase [Trichonephila clavipes]
MYVDILDNAALHLYGNISGKPHFYSSRIHTSRLTQTWFDEMGVQKLDWPSQSPDLNPIKLLWDKLESRLCSQPNRPSSLQTLTSAVMNAWKAIPMVTYQKWVEVSPNVRRLSSMQKGDQHHDNMCPRTL